jgi:hypothetical protein
MQPVSQIQRLRSFSLTSEVKTGGSGLPGRYVVYGPEGVGNPPPRGCGTVAGLRDEPRGERFPVSAGN